jgi:hypothetical protein
MLPASVAVPVPKPKKSYLPGYLPLASGLENHIVDGIGEYVLPI